MVNRLRSSTDKTVCYVAYWIVGIYDSIFKISNELCDGVIECNRVWCNRVVSIFANNFFHGAPSFVQIYSALGHH